MSEGFTKENRAEIPGPQQPSFIRPREQARPAPVGRFSHARLLKPCLIGDRYCAAGDVIKVSDPPKDAMGRTMAMNIMPPLPLLLEERARWLVEHGYAEPHSGPATQELGASMSVDDSLASMALQIEAATNPQPKRAEREVTPRQKAGAL